MSRLPYLLKSDCKFLDVFLIEMIAIARVLFFTF